MEYLSEKSFIKRAKKELAMSSIFDEIIHKYSQSSSTSIESMQPGQVIKGTDGVSYTVVKDNTSGEKFFAPAQGQPGQQQQQEQQVQQPQDLAQQVQDPNQYAMQPSGADKPDENKPEPMGAKTSKKRAQALQGLTDQDWSDIKSMGSDISQYAEKQNMKGVMEVIEDLTDLTLSFINLPENM